VATIANCCDISITESTNKWLDQKLLKKTQKAVDVIEKPRLVLSIGFAK